MLDAAPELQDNLSEGDSRHQLISKATVRALFDGVSDMTIWRWQNDPDLGFPQPVYVQRRCFWRRQEIIDFIECRPRDLSTPPVGNRHQQKDG